MENKRLTIQEMLPGAWELVSYQVMDSRGNVTYPLGADATGMAIFLAEGFMSVQIMSSGRPLYAGGDIHQGPDNAMIAAAKGYLAYSGSYQIFEDQGMVEQQMEVSLNPNWAGDNQPRYIQFLDERLIINSQPVFIHGQEQNTKLIWKRAES
ncbi:lipocalin-like domain-containing protein [Halobacillus rhizosphaerae]|uniref:lipocalin-like domain-containing protein n=1 Tax=Halobacillus rhizosphaerae TaxID=3064889 RepID=UPI00398ABFA8